MKRVRGLDEVASPAAATLKHSSVSAGSGLGGGGGGLEYHSSSGIGVVVPGQAVRSVASKEMPGSIQFGTAQAQQQYTGAIVVPTAAPSPIKVRFIYIIITTVTTRKTTIMFSIFPDIYQVNISFSFFYSIKQLFTFLKCYSIF